MPSMLKPGQAPALNLPLITWPICKKEFLFVRKYQKKIFGASVTTNLSKLML